MTNKPESVSVTFERRYGVWQPTFADHVSAEDRRRIIGALGGGNDPDALRNAVRYMFPDAVVTFRAV